jgi:hypothetical protein
MQTIPSRYSSPEGSSSFWGGLCRGVPTLSRRFNHCNVPSIASFFGPSKPRSGCGLFTAPVLQAALCS